MPKAIAITATNSGSGKTLLSMALLNHFKDRARAFKVGPDFIDPQFHQYITKNASINLDGFIMNENQIKWLFNHYLDDKIGLIEGVMGFYDGLERKASTYDITTILNIPTILILSAKGTYTTLLAILKGMLEYKKNSIKTVVLNHISSQMHYTMIKNLIEAEFDIKVLGFIKKDLKSITSRHLGLNLNELESGEIREISNEVLENLNLKELEKLAEFIPPKIDFYPFEKVPKSNLTLGVVYDENFSFLYYDNLQLFKKIFKEVKIISAVNDDIISKDIDNLYICGGYVETKEAYSKIKNSNKFKESLIEFSKTKPIYAECAGLIYLGNKIDDFKMSGILNIDFTMQDKRERLGYYLAKDNLKDTIYKGHAFHYSKPLNIENGIWQLAKRDNFKINGTWKKKKVVGTYLHTMFRSELNIINSYLKG